MIGAVLFRGANALSQEECFTDILLPGKATCHDRVPEQTSTISGLDLLAVSLSLSHFRQRFTRKSHIFIDNNAAIGALVQAQAAKNPSHTPVSDIWAIACFFSMSIWSERVPSGVNIADLPKRFGAPSYRALNNEGSHPLNEWLNYANRIYTPIF